jgi:hypothetical protein
MARLRKPSSVEPPIFIPPTTTTKSTRSSPRKTVRESPTTRELRHNSSQNLEDSLLVPKASTSISPIRKQRVLRPIESNSRLLRKISDGSLAATPDRKERRERNLNGQAGYLYSKTLAKSVVRKQGAQRKIDAEIEVESVAEQATVEDENDMEKSIFCGDEEGPGESDKENTREVEEDDDEEDNEPVVVTRQRWRQPQARRVISDDEEDDSEEEESAEVMQRNNSRQPVTLKPAMEMPPPLTSMRPPQRKGYSTVSNWAQEVVDLTSSPGPPASFVLAPPAQARTSSFAASSRPTSSASNDVDAMLHLYV